MMTPLEPSERRKRKRELILFGVLSVVFVGLTIAELRLSSISTTLPFVNSIFFFGLLNLNILILITLCWLVFRNVGKLFLERRRKVLGSALKTKLVIAFLAFSIIPTLVLFVISAAYINSSFDKWFSIKVQNTLQASLEITGTYYRNTQATAAHFAEHIAVGILRRPAQLSIETFLLDQRELLALDAVEFYRDPLDERILALRPRSEGEIEFPRLTLELLDRAFGGEKVPVMQHVGTGDLIRYLVPVRASAGAPVQGVISVSTYIPISIVNKVDEIASVFDDYKEVNPLKYPMKTMYFVILILITLVILFVAIWIGLYLARELTVPLERLVFGAREVGAGNLDVTISGSGHDEIAVLVDSFNTMTRDLRVNRERLNEANLNLEKRRAQIETVLANIGTGVIVVDRDRRLTTFNRALESLLQIPAREAIGKSVGEVFPMEDAPVFDLVEQTFDLENIRSRGQAPISGRWKLKADTQGLVLNAVATPLWDVSEARPWGVVVVIDDITHLMKDQREMAWREVARRIAHEIKNPLTPIKLSAQRLQRQLSNYRGREASLLQECTDTIIKHSDELKEMVNEFSNFARLPEISTARHDLNVAIREVSALYVQAHPEIHFREAYEVKLPPFDFDRDQIKRVMINLLDNAVAAVQSRNQPSGAAPLSISITTYFHERLKLGLIEIKDSGPGMTEEVRARVFEPYFSTKKEGTGLGLAITKRIINDHQGYIRVQSSPEEGTVFLIELPTQTNPSLA